ncbi:MAG: hypothetical protein IJB67_01040 [Firmicutes bacterium]|nr:hypothetical protein [Bacillota bacterium]
MKKKVIALALGCTVAFGCAVGGTLAWLTDTTTEVKNTFTTSDITITLTESVDTDNDGAESFKMVPGHTIAKDPMVTVKANSEPCWLFIKVAESEGSWSTLTDSSSNDIVVWDSLLTYSVIDGTEGWTAVDGKPGYYCRKVFANEADQNFYILAGSNNGQVNVSEDVTKEMMTALNGDGKEYPTLTFTAAAVQLYATNGTEFDVAGAWGKLPGAFTGEYAVTP